MQGVSSLSEQRPYLTLPPVPVNLKDQDAFHLAIEEYLQALISLIDELVRVTMPPRTPRTEGSTGSLSSQLCDPRRLPQAFGD